MWHFRKFEICLLLAFLICLGTIVLQKDSSPYYQICTTNQYNGYKECTPHHIPYVIAWYIGHFFDIAASVITAFATAAIAYFTWTIWGVNQTQLDRGERIERAYISGGGAPEYEEINSMTTGAYVAGKPHLAPQPMKTVRETNFFRLDINNHGKTEGQIVEYGYGWCEIDKVADLPERPIYRWVYFRDQIGPGTQSRPIKRIWMPQGKRVIFGRYGYIDIFGKRHSDGFIQHRGNPIAPPHASYTEADPAWDLPYVGKRKYEQEEN